MIKPATVLNLDWWMRSGPLRLIAN
jgi:hypothetical protein